ncbi:sigma-70 family RNA polymerase sigma factor [Candidatus Peregrinibacteria bacterium]|nr:sigma-70 family RNA polymerase sigma factor [Candidatus Peregrinibacteria bacterium]
MSGSSDEAQAGALQEQELLALVRQAQEGNVDAFEKLYKHFFVPVYRYAAFRLPREVAEDTVADIFVKAWEKLHRYRERRGVPFGAWLFRIARHAVIDVYRSQRGFEEVPEDLPDPDPLNHPSRTLEQKELLRVVRAALAELPRRYREVLILTFIAELPHSEIARVLHKTPGGVRVLKLRALRRLETLLPPEYRNSA